jgi:hypothetical protein
MGWSPRRTANAVRLLSDGMCGTQQDTIKCMAAGLVLLPAGLLCCCGCQMVMGVLLTAEANHYTAGAPHHVGASTLNVNVGY